MHGSSMTLMKKACCCCDVLLDHRNSTVIELIKLANKKWLKPDESDPASEEFYKREYCLPKSRCKELSQPQRNKLATICVSPRSAIVMDNKTAYLSICQECVNTKKGRPKKSFMNIPIGSEPPVLANLNDAELALVSLGRISGHVFHIFAGSHKTIKTFHQIHVNNVGHTMGAVSLLHSANRLTAIPEHEELGEMGEAEDTPEMVETEAVPIRPDIYCILSGPFTPHQKSVALKSVAIDTGKIIAAFEWLKANNALYADVVVPDSTTIPMPVVIDQSREDESQGNNIETTHVTTVIFPELGDIDEAKSAYTSKTEFMQEVLFSGKPSQIKIISKPTTDLVKHWSREQFVQSFPRQFPFGLGCKPAGISTEEYTKHLLKISNNSFQRAEFILIIANIHFKDAVVRTSSLKCQYMSGTQTSEDRFNDIDIDEIDYILDHPETIDNDPHSNISHFVRQVFAISKILPFSDEATRKQRTNLFSMCTQFGLPTGLLTVTPDDSDNFNMYVYKNEEIDFVSMLHSSECEGIKSYLSDCEQIRLNFPGYAELEFENVMDIVINDILGWDCENGRGTVDGGLFGDLNAWFLAVEEQGRKTLHGHFLIWTKDWDMVLKNAYKYQSTNDDAMDTFLTESAATVMTEFMNSAVSTDCFDIKIPIRHSSTNVRGHYTMRDIALCHECIDDDPNFEFCTDQQLRNMRFQHCPNTEDQMHIAKCLKCDTKFTLNAITTSTLSSIITDKLNMPVDSLHHQQVLRYIISISQSGVEDLEPDIDRLHPQIKIFLIHLHRNLHKQCHTFTCFKKGCECRSKLPAKYNNTSSCEFLDQHSINWFKWNGEKNKRNVFRLIPKRSELDVFTNTYNPFISELFHCNTNLQCGIDGAGIMYVTCYTCKSTKKEEKEHQLCILESLKRVMNKELANAPDENEETEMPRKTAFRRVLASALSITSNYSISAPMAKYLVLNGSRFRCSHNFSQLPFYDFCNEKTTYASLDVSKKNTVFLSARRDTYLYRPELLEDEAPMSFYSKYQVQTAHGSILKDKDCLRFKDNAPTGYSNLCLMPRENLTIPTVHYLLFHNAALLLQDITNPDVDTNATVEDQCKRLLLLFTSFRSEKDILIDDTYKKSLITKIATECIDKNYEKIMQNMQDCRNSLESGHVPDILEERTDELPEPEASKRNKKQRQPTDEALAHIDQQMSNLIAEINDSFNQDSNKDCRSFNLSKLTNQGGCGIGDDRGLLPSVVSDLEANLFWEDGNHTGTSRTKKRSHVDVIPKVHRQTLIAAQKVTTFRSTILSDTEKQKTENINCTGSCESIVAWAKAVFDDDTDQTMAFQSLIADFVLQFLNCAVDDGVQRSTDIRVWKNGLLELRGLPGHNGNKRVVMFLTGPGGSGKSHVIHNIMEYAKRYTLRIGQPFTSSTIVVTALTGVAATSILGETLHSALGIGITGKFKKAQTEDLRGNQKLNDWRETKLLIVDEISFASKPLLETLARALSHLKENDRDPFGGISVCFAGDFSQLEPVSGVPIYKGDQIKEWYTWVNAFVQLRGGHRFSDSNYRDILTRLRISVLTDDDKEALKSRVVNKKDLSIIPPGTQIACADNKDRCALNSLAFHGHLKATHKQGLPGPNHTLVVKMSEMKWMSNKKGITEEAKHTIYEDIPDYKVKRGKDGKFTDPLLKLYIGAPVMLTENEDVKNGIANGTTGKIKSIILKDGALENLHLIKIDGYEVNCIDANLVNVIMIEIERPNQPPTEFSMSPVEMKARVLMPIETFGRIEHFDVQISCSQFTFLVNHATTVHKLQGRTLNSLYVANWCYSQNWVYVALSRVKTLRDLYLRKQMNDDKNLRPRSELIRMTELFERTKSLKYPEDN